MNIYVGNMHHRAYVSLEISGHKVRDGGGAPNGPNERQSSTSRVLLSYLEDQEKPDGTLFTMLAYLHDDACPILYLWIWTLQG